MKLRNIAAIASLLFFTNASAQYMISNTTQNSFDPKLRRSLSRIIGEEVDSTTTLGYVILKEENPRKAKLYSNRIERKLIDKTRDYLNKNIGKRIEDYRDEDKKKAFEKMKHLIRSFPMKYDENLLFLSYALRKGKANCYALSDLYKIIGDALGLPIKLVSIPEDVMPPGRKGHMFVRWDLDGKHNPLDSNDVVNIGDVNWECSSGAEISDKFYIDTLKLDRKAIEKGALKTLNTRQGLVIALELIADNYIQNGNIGEREQSIFSHILELDPNNYFALRNKSTCSFINKRYGEVIPVLERLNGIKASDRNHYFLGIARCETGDTTGAINEFENALKINPGHEKSIFELAGISIRRKEYGKAIRLYDEVIMINPKNWVAYHNRGIAKQRIGDRKGAELDKEKADLLR